jgi:alpha-amylase
VDCFKFSFAAKFVREYVEALDPMFSVGEYWVSCNYDPSSNHLDYNQGMPSLKQDLLLHC